jgi:protocatechuate 3,4-dioxygenase beta subunit
MKRFGMILLVTSILIGLFTGCYSGKQIGSNGGIKGQVVEADGATPVAGAEIKLISGNITEVSRTDQYGKFAVTVKAGKSYQLVAKTNGFQSSVIATSKVMANKTLDLGRIILKGLGTLTGNVVDQNGNPIQNGNVQIIDENGNIVAEGNTDISGNINIGDLPEGNYTVIVTNPDGSLTVTIPNVVVAPGSTTDLGTVVAVPSDEGVSVLGKVVDKNQDLLSGVKVNFVNASTSQTVKSVISQVGEGVVNNISEKVPAAVYAVQYIKSGYHTFTLYNQKINSNPFQLPTVQLTGTSEPTGGLKGQIVEKDSGKGQDGVIITVKSGEKIIAAGVTGLMSNGVFTISNIPAGVYAVTFESPAIQSIVKENVEIKAGQVTDLGIVNGQANSGLTGIIQDQDGNPVEGATVILYDSSGNVVATATTDVSGNFTFDNVLPGSGYTVEISLDGYDTVTLNNGGSGYSVSTGSYTDITGSDSAITFNKSIGSIRVTVQDEITKSPVSGISLKVDSESKTTESSGVAVFQNKESHKAYNIVFNGNTIYKAATLNTGVLETNQTLEKTILLVRKTATISQDGISLSDDGNSANGGTVHITNPSLGVDITVGIEDGTVSIPDLPYDDQGGYTIEIIYDDNYNPIVIDDVSITDSDPTLEEIIGNPIVFQPSDQARAGIKVTVQDENSAPLPGISVKIGAETYQTDGSGVVNTGYNLTLGSYTVLVNENSLSNWKYGVKSFTVSANQVNQTVLKTIGLVRKAASLSVTMKNSQTNTGIGGHVVLTSGSATYEMNTDLHGIATFSNIPFDNYAISAVSSGYVSVNQAFKHDGTVNPTLRLQVDADVKYSINVNGLGEGETTLTLMNNGNVVQTVVVNGDSGAISGVVAGTYTIKAEKEYYQPITTPPFDVPGASGDITISFGQSNPGMGDIPGFDDSGNGTDAGSRKKGSLSGSVVLSDASGENGTITVSLSGTAAATKSINAPGGDFSFTGINQGEYTLQVNYPNYIGISRNITVDGDETAGSLNLEADYGTVNFAVNATSGYSASGAVISFNGVNYTADSNGEKNGIKIKAGSYGYSVSKTNFVPSSGTLSVTSGTTVSETVNLDAYAAVKGIVKSGSTLFPNAIVTLSGTENQTISLDSNAYFEVRVKPGTYTLKISNLGYGYEDVSDSFTLAAGEVYNLQTSWDPADTGSGSDIGDSADLQPYELNVSVSGNSAPLSGVTVSIGATQYTADASGNVNGVLVQKGAEYDIKVSNLPEGYVNKSKTVTISQKNTNVSFSLSRTQIQVSSNEPATTFKVYASDGTLLGSYSAGTYPAAPGAYRVKASANGYKSEEMTQNVTEGQTVNYSFNLIQFASVSGKITDGNGNPVSGVQIVFTGPENITVYTDSNGDFSVELLPGTYNYEINPPAGYQPVTGSQNFGSGSNVLGESQNIVLQAMGSVSGKLVSWADMNEAIIGAMVTLYDSSGNRVSSSVSGSGGYFNMSAPVGDNMSLRIDPISYNGKDYTTASKSGVRITAGQNTNVGNIYMPLQGNWTDGTLSGKIIHAVYGSRYAISGADVEVRIGGTNGPIAQLYKNGAPAGDAVTTTDSNGYFRIGDDTTGLIDGQVYTIVVKKSGYTDPKNSQVYDFVDASVENVIVDGTTDIGVIGLSPKLPAGEIRITLKWQSDGYDYASSSTTNSTLAGYTRDLDGHLVGPKNGGGYFHVYWNDKNADGSNDGSSSNGTSLSHPFEAWQDIDDTVYCTRNGETITMKTGVGVRAAGTYTYTVHNWNDRYGEHNWLSRYSNSVVSVYDSRGMLAQINIEPNSAWAANGWKVFELLVNSDQTYSVREINSARQISSYSSADGVRSGTATTTDTSTRLISEGIQGQTK